MAFPHVHIQHRIDDTSSSGGDFISGALRTRPLNFIEHDDVGITLSANQIILPEGTYNVFAMAQAFAVGHHQLFWVDITGGSAVLLLGSTELTSGGQSAAFVGGQIEVVGTRTYELQHQCENSRFNNGFGLSMTFGEPQIYADVLLEKTA